MQATRKNTPTEKALIERGITPVAFEDRFTGRADDEALTINCGRCGGSGEIAAYRPVNGGTCFGCDGAGVARHTTVGEERRRDREDVNKMNRKRLRYAKEAEAEREAKAAKIAEVDAKRAEFLAEHDGLADALDVLPGDFGVSLRAALADRGSLTENQVAAAYRVAAEVAERGEAAPVVEGRGTVTGTVCSVKVAYTDFGDTLKMIVEDDRGFRVYGTVPAAIADDIETGARVEFVARTVASDDDKTFGFFSRPSKARMV